MKDLMQFADWLGVDVAGLINRYGAVAAAGLVLLLSLIQVSRHIKCKPWSWLLARIGDAINANVRHDIAQVNTYTKSLGDGLKDLWGIYHIDKANAARKRILRFGDALSQQNLHTRELWDDILDDITQYEHYCASHPEYLNDKAKLTIEHIRDTYRECLDNNHFL